MKTYTTGQIIDVLKPGQQAKCVEGDYQGRTITFHGRDFTWAPQEYVHLDVPLLQCKWQLVPRYVTFEEAKKAYEEGKKVQVEVPGYNNREQIHTRTYKNCGDGSDDVGDPFSWYIVVKGKWQIVEEESA